MQKDGKPDRYADKDYDEVVGFPVEIRGRDGDVRHYDFVSSVRLYQRRLAHAASRFVTPETVAAERGHCRARIAQLRRSYFLLHGWTSPEGTTGPEVELPELAAEIAAVLWPVWGGSGRLSLSFAPIPGAGGFSTWFVQPVAGGPGLLLHVLPLGEEREPEPREAAAFLRRLASVTEGAGVDQERLVARHDVNDAIIVLTGRAAEVLELPVVAATGEVSGAWDDMERLVLRADLAGLWLCCRAWVDDQPWHRDAYVVGALAARLMGRPADAEALAFVGTRYLERDALVWRELALARLDQGRVDEALADLSHAVEVDPGCAAACADRFRVGLATGVLQVPSAAAMRSLRPGGDTKRLIAALHRVRAWQRRGLAVQGVALGVIGVWMAWTVSALNAGRWEGVALAMLVGVLAAGAARVAFREARAVLRRDMDQRLRDDLSRALGRLKRGPDR